LTEIESSPLVAVESATFSCTTSSSSADITQLENETIAQAINHYDLHTLQTWLNIEEKLHLFDNLIDELFTECAPLNEVLPWTQHELETDASEEEESNGKENDESCILSSEELIHYHYKQLMYHVRRAPSICA